MEIEVVKNTRSKQAVFPGNILRHRTTGGLYLVSQGPHRLIQLYKPYLIITIDELLGISKEGIADLQEWEVFKVVGPIPVEPA